MATKVKTEIMISARIKAPLEKTWQLWTDPKHIVHWNNASDDWFTPRAKNDLKNGGKFNYRMEARDGSDGFDFSGTYTQIVPQKRIGYNIDDGRKVKIEFSSEGEETVVKESFEPEQTHTVEQQREGWQSILENFKKYTETYEVKFIPLHFEVCINAKRDKVCGMMLGKETYPGWTTEFNPSSRFEGTWEKGTTMRFLGIDKDGSEGGMACRVRENIRNRFVSIEYSALIKNGKEITSGEEAMQWTGGRENYSFFDENGRTLVSVDVDCSPQFVGYFNETWPRALRKLKQNCEK
jgi:uncharacterized protein YndB with AHSA1/START domain